MSQGYEMNYNLGTYDIESYPNFFSFTLLDRQTKQLIQFEASWRKNNIPLLLQWLEYWKINQYKHIGYNNIGYDYPMTHSIITDPQYYDCAERIYEKNEQIISTPWERRFDNLIRPWDVVIPQIDLMKVHHFDNDAKRTSLKQLEFVRRSDAIEDLPYPPGIAIPQTDEAADTVLRYNAKDVYETDGFADDSMKELEFRDLMSSRYNSDFTNHNDTKIGKSYFIMQLENAGVKCFDGNRKPLQTYRDGINLGEIIFPYVAFNRQEFKDVVSHLQATTIQETKGALNLSAVVDDFQFDFGLGGIHGSVESETFYSDDEYIITDADVTSYYPSLAIKNRVFPAHLSEKFCDVYEDVFNQRKGYKKGTVENAAMKLALNGVYGDSNSKFSPFYDPQYTMTITVNGQLLLCMLAEQLMRIPKMRMIQINTDGLTIRYPRRYKEHYDTICDWWQSVTALNLEFIDYKSMHVRDVNNYIAVPFEGSVKYKGAYVFNGAHTDAKDKLAWHKNHSALIVKIAAAKAIVEGIPVRQTIMGHTELFDFFLLAKVGRKDTLQLQADLYWNDDLITKDAKVKNIQRISRYLVTNTGNKLVKIMPPLKRRTPKVQMHYPGWQSKKITGCNKNLEVTNLNEYQNALRAGYKAKDGGSYDIGPYRHIGIDKQHLVTIVNDLEDTNVQSYDINYQYYIDEAEKLVNGVVGLK